MSATPPTGPWSEPDPYDPRLAETQPLQPAASSKPPDDKPPAGQHRDRIEYLAAFRAVWERPDWMRGVIIGGLIGIIPIVGNILWFGYMYEVVEVLHRRPKARYPLFDINRFTLYLTRGVWPFLVWFVLQTVVGPMIQIFVQVPIFILAAISEQNESAAVLIGAIAVPFIILVLVGLVVGSMLLTTPLMLRGGLAQDAGKIFNVTWIKDFWRRMWKEILLVDVFVMFAGIVMSILGLFLCCIGMAFAQMYVLIALSLLTLQLYELYLSRGGEPIPLKPPTAENALPPTDV